MAGLYPLTELSMNTFIPVSRVSGLMTKLSSPALMPAVVFPSRLLLPMPMPEVLTFMFSSAMKANPPASTSASVRLPSPSSCPMASIMLAVVAVASTPKKTISSDNEGIAGSSVSGINKVRTGSGPPASSEPSALLRTTVEPKPCTRSRA
ncbi:hypothetical protein D3C80_1631700 [compost metagenome]